MKGRDEFTSRPFYWRLMKKYWPFTLPFIFFGVCFFFMRVKPRLDMLACERDFRTEMLQAGSVDVISEPWRSHGSDFDRKLGTIQGDKLHLLLDDIHLQLKPYPYMYDASDSGYRIESSDKPSKGYLYFNASFTLGSMYFPESRSRTMKYELTPESRNAIQQILSSTWVQHFKKSNPNL